ncbi:porin family protein [Massilia sp. TWP1-3-3]|uniref:porin family protein n=1 Tax=Massilia sp. TWP1-3-3 TaxID=2804573 RepID=UPI003CF3B913
MKKLIFAVLAGVAAMSAAQAQQISSPYIGLGVASADHDFKIGAAGSSSSDGWKASGKIFGGFDVNPMFGVEAGYTDVRKADHTYTIGATTGSATTEGSRSYLAAKATMPMNDGFSLYGKLGVGYSKTKMRSTTLGNANDSDTEVYAGLGGQYKISDKVALSLEYERYGKNKDFGVKANAVTLGARYSF